MTKLEFNNFLKDLYQVGGISLNTHPILIAEYSGSGDSGDFEWFGLSNAESLTKEKDYTLISEAITINMPHSGQPVLDFLYENYNPNNEGSSGYSILNLKNLKMKQYIEFFYTESDSEDFESTLPLS